VPSPAGSCQEHGDDPPHRRRRLPGGLADPTSADPVGAESAAADGKSARGCRHGDVPATSHLLAAMTSDCRAITDLHAHQRAHAGQDRPAPGLDRAAAGALRVSVLRIGRSHPRPGAALGAVSGCDQCVCGRLRIQMCGRVYPPASPDTWNCTDLAHWSTTRGRGPIAELGFRRLDGLLPAGSREGSCEQRSSESL
jgi:hypothetical protein